MNKDTEKQIRRLISGEASELSSSLTNELVALGLNYQVKGGIVNLAEDIELLGYDRILDGITSDVSLDLHWSIESTNDYLMKAGVARGSTAVCMAEQQIAGRGRRGKVWISPFGKNIYMSLGRYFDGGASGLVGLSLVIGSCVVATLRALGVESVGLKWPNDIILGAGKLGGILVELGKLNKESTFVVMGIGINLELSEESSRQIDQPWSHIGDDATISRNDLAAGLIESLMTAFYRFEKDGFISFAEEWNSNNVYKGQEVVILQGEDRIGGIDAGVDHSGNYLLETATGVQVFNAGEVSLRLNAS